MIFVVGTHTHTFIHTCMHTFYTHTWLHTYTHTCEIERLDKYARFAPKFWREKHASNTASEINWANLVSILFRQDSVTRTDFPFCLRKHLTTKWNSYTSWSSQLRPLPRTVIFIIFWATCKGRGPSLETLHYKGDVSIKPSTETKKIYSCIWIPNNHYVIANDKSKESLFYRKYFIRVVLTPYFINKLNPFRNRRRAKNQPSLRAKENTLPECTHTKRQHSIPRHHIPESTEG